MIGDKVASNDILVALLVCAAKYTKVLNTVTPNIDIIITFIHEPFMYLIVLINFFIQNGVSTIKVTNTGGMLSMFDPVLCELMYYWFCTDGGKMLDPFCGGSFSRLKADVLGWNIHTASIHIHKALFPRVCSQKM